MIRLPHKTIIVASHSYARIGGSVRPPLYLHGRILIYVTKIPLHSQCSPSLIRSKAWP
jgi:hypothetical protein